MKIIGWIIFIGVFILVASFLGIIPAIILAVIAILPGRSFLI